MIGVGRAIVGFHETIVWPGFGFTLRAILSDECRIIFFSKTTQR